MSSRSTPHPQFGVAGTPVTFFTSPWAPDRERVPEWLSSIGLGALEIQCGHGVRLSEERAALLKVHASNCQIALSIHAPYYVSLTNPAQIERSLVELTKCIMLARWTGADRIVFHLGSARENRSASLQNALQALRRFQGENDTQGICLYAETAGKLDQLGSLEEVLAISSRVPGVKPCIDFAHLHARTHGSLTSDKQFDAVLENISREAGQAELQHAHFHMCPIEWGQRGEIRHRNFSERISSSEPWLFAEAAPTSEMYLPRYEPFLREVFRRRLTPRIICESTSQDVDALLMSRFWNSLNDA